MRIRIQKEEYIVCNNKYLDLSINQSTGNRVDKKNRLAVLKICKEQGYPALNVEINFKVSLAMKDHFYNSVRLV